jgi:hypothetical protein
MTDWFEDEDGHRWRPAELPPPHVVSTPPQHFYEAMYRRARSQLHLPPGELSKQLRKHWRGQLWTAQVCLKNYFGAEPPAEEG